MPVKVAYANLDAVPEPLRAQAVTEGDKVFVQLEGDADGMVPTSELIAEKKQVETYRNNNRDLNTKVVEAAAALKAYDGVDAAEYKKLKKTADDAAAALAAGKGGGQDDWEAKLAKTIEPLQNTIAGLTEKVEKAEADKVTAEEAVVAAKVEGLIRDTGVLVGIADTAMKDYIGRGKGVWKMGENGTPVAMNDDDTPMLSDQTGKNLTLDEWARGLQTTAPHLFKPSKGGGADPRPGGTGPKRIIDWNDPVAIGENQEAIKKGEVIVRRPA